MYVNHPCEPSTILCPHLSSPKLFMAPLFQPAPPPSHNCWQVPNSFYISCLTVPIYLSKLESSKHHS